MSGQVVVITGAAQGIGAALARRYAKAGARLALLDIDKAGAEVLANELGITTEAMAVECDVTSLEACNDAVAAVIARFGGVDVLVANAGITHLSAFEDTEVEVIRKVMEVNFFGAVNSAKACLPSLLERKGQAIVISSVAGILPLPLRTGYSASKYAVRGFFETLRAENAHKGLRVMVVFPSFVETEIGAKAIGGDGTRSVLGRPEAEGASSPIEVADQIFAAGQKGKHVLPVAKGAKLAYVLSRLSPGLLEKLSIRKVFGAREG